MTPTILDELFEVKAQTIDRISPTSAAAAMRNGSVLVDIRSFEARERYGVVPGSIHIPRTVLEWRLEHDGAWRSPHVVDGKWLIVLCDHGYSSVFAAAALVELGWRAGDVVGGFEAWRADGLPTQPAADTPLGDDELPGMRPPEKAR